MNLYKKITHRPTAALRFLERAETLYQDSDVAIGHKVRVLQQLWEPVEGCNEAQHEWRDVPMVTE